MSTKIYKILTHEQWALALKTGVFEGAPVDIQDGFIHFSTAEQVEETASKHFSGQSDLLLITFGAERFGEKLKWEPSRGGALFPHLYDALDPSEAIATHKLPARSDGGHDFPETY